MSNEKRLRRIKMYNFILVGQILVLAGWVVVAFSEWKRLRAKRKHWKDIWAQAEIDADKMIADIDNSGTTKKEEEKPDA